MCVLETELTAFYFQNKYRLRVMDTVSKICCFAGHKDIYDNSIKEKIKEHLITLIEKENVKKFWVGNYGDFDSYSASVVRELKQTYPDITLELVIPYITKEINDYKELYYKSYDCILIADIPASTPARYKIIKANQYMVDNSAYLICCVRRSYGGAARTLEYAKRKNHIKIFNLAGE